MRVDREAIAALASSELGDSDLSLVAKTCSDIGLCIRCVVRIVSPAFSSVKGSEPLPDELLLESEEGIAEALVEYRRNESVCPACLGMLSDDAISAAVSMFIRKVVDENPYTAHPQALCGNSLFSFLTISLPVTQLIREFSVLGYLLKNAPNCALAPGWTDSRLYPSILEVKDLLKQILCIRINRGLKKACVKVPITIDFIERGSAPLRLETAFEFKCADLRMDLDLFKGLNSFKKEKQFEQRKNKHCKVETPDSAKYIFRSLQGISPIELTDKTGYPIPPPPISCSIEMELSVKLSPFYLIASYNKYSRELSQTPWHVNDDSVQNLITEPLKSLFKTDCKFYNHSKIMFSIFLCVLIISSAFKFSTAGREDADVRMLGGGRLFSLQVNDAHYIPSKDDDALVAESLVNKSTSRIQISKTVLQATDGLDVLKEGEESKRKIYRAVIWLSNPFCEADIQKFLPPTPLCVKQETPIRVLHRRTALTRDKIVYRLSMTSLNPHYAILDLDSSAGMYIKEFVHGDRGRTFPSIASIFGCDADILQLDVLDIEKQSSISVDQQCN